MSTINDEKDMKLLESSSVFTVSWVYIACNTNKHDLEKGVALKDIERSENERTSQTLFFNDKKQHKLNHLISYSK